MTWASICNLRYNLHISYSACRYFFRKSLLHKYYCAALVVGIGVVVLYAALLLSQHVVLYLKYKFHLSYFCLRHIYNASVQHVKLNMYLTCNLITHQTQPVTWNFSFFKLNLLFGCPFVYFLIFKATRRGFVETSTPDFKKEMYFRQRITRPAGTGVNRNALARASFRLSGQRRWRVTRGAFKPRNAGRVAWITFIWLLRLGFIVDRLQQRYVLRLQRAREIGAVP